ncbi:hypothetical protein SPRG_18742, partial [Saprolegnia parasitica CBS 223.65]
ICSHLASRKARVVWLHGPSDVGKTQLACSAAHALQLTRIFARGITFISVEDIDETCPGVANDAGLDELKLQVDTWLAATADRSSEPQAATLILLDGVDALVASRPFVTWLDDLCIDKQYVQLLVTSRAVAWHIDELEAPHHKIEITPHTALAPSTRHQHRRRIQARDYDAQRHFEESWHTTSMRV